MYTLIILKIILIVVLEFIIFMYLLNDKVYDYVHKLFKVNRNDRYSIIPSDSALFGIFAFIILLVSSIVTFAYTIALIAPEKFNSFSGLNYVIIVLTILIIVIILVTIMRLREYKNDKRLSILDLTVCNECNNLLYRYQLDVITINLKIKKINELKNEGSKVNTLKEGLKLLSTINNCNCPKCEAKDSIKNIKYANLSKDEIRQISDAYNNSINGINASNKKELKQCVKLLKETNDLLDCKLNEIISTDGHWTKLIYGEKDYNKNG